MEDIRLYTNLSVLGLCFICDQCLIVDRNHDRMKNNHICDNCGKPSTAKIYFNVGINEILKLLEGYLSKNIEANGVKNDELSKFPIIVFFCSLGELLLSNFIIYYFKKEKIPKTIQKRLLDDNLTVSKRLNKLLPSMLNMNWNKIIRKLNKNSNYDYMETMEFYKKIIELRNNLIHRGTTWLIDDKIPYECIKKIRSLIQFFMDLHNAYITIE